MDGSLYGVLFKKRALLYQPSHSPGPISSFDLVNMYNILSFSKAFLGAFSGMKYQYHGQQGKWAIALTLSLGM